MFIKAAALIMKLHFMIGYLGILNFGNRQRRFYSIDITTRRALMPIFIPNDLKNLPKDTSCASSIQIMIRETKGWISFCT